MQSKSTIKSKLHEIIFEADTVGGKVFDIGLLVAIIGSIVVVMLDSVESYQKNYGDLLNNLEWIFTIFFTFEYLLRVFIIGKPKKYIFSFYGIIDLLSILPSYLGLFALQGSGLIVIRSLRLLRVFRVLKLVQFLGEAQLLFKALKDSGYKITVFVLTVLTFTIIFGTIMYQIEGAENGFTSIPKSVYWAIVTLTTVGYGDIAPQTVVGQAIASIIMILGYGIIAVPTGLVTAELVKSNQNDNTVSCSQCSLEGHDSDAEFCKFCGSQL